MILQTKELDSVRGFIVFFTKKLRLSNPWNFKAPLLITFPYLLFLLSNYSEANTFYGILVSITVIVGVSGLGYLSNDLGDRKKDALIVKENILVGMQPAAILFLFLLFFMLAFLPWLYLPFNSLSAILLILEIVLFFVYAIPPFRFKERRLLGVYTDSLYAHVLPAVLAAYTFQLFTRKNFEKFSDFAILVFFWQFVQGVRNILFHQIKDLESDEKSGTRTFVTFIGLERALKLIKKIVLPLEILILGVFLIFLAFFWGHSFVLILSLIYFFTTLISHWKKLASMDYRARAYLFLDDFYIQWFPLIILTELCMTSLSFLPIVILHLLLFKNGIKSILKNKLPFLN
jgi:4-hydroxybenzoate polyprenyltransferase